MLSNLPPGCSNADIERACLGEECRCGHVEADHGADPPFDAACGVHGCACEAYEEPEYDEADPDDEDPAAYEPPEPEGGWPRGGDFGGSRGYGL